MIPNLTFLAGLFKAFFADTPIGKAATEVPMVRLNEFSSFHFCYSNEFSSFHFCNF
jgi:hypothetical protein